MIGKFLISFRWISNEPGAESILTDFSTTYYKPVFSRYWHRSINPKKLVEVQFSSLHQRMTLQRMMRIYRVPDVSVVWLCVPLRYPFFLPQETKVAGLRLMEPRDAPSLLTLLHQVIHFVFQYTICYLFIEFFFL